MSNNGKPRGEQVSCPYNPDEDEEVPIVEDSLISIPIKKKLLEERVELNGHIMTLKDALEYDLK